MDPMLDELERWLPVTDANRNLQRVVAPGCGLGRIVLEIARSVLIVITGVLGVLLKSQF